MNYTAILFIIQINSNNDFPSPSFASLFRLFLALIVSRLFRLFSVRHFRLLAHHTVSGKPHEHSRGSSLTPIGSTD